MLLLRWAYFAQPVPDAEVLCLALDDYLDDEVEEDLYLGRQPFEDDYQSIFLLEDFFEDELEDEPLLGRQPLEDDYQPILLLVDEVEDEAEEEDIRPIALPEGDDFIAIQFFEDGDEDADEDIIVFNFDFAQVILDITEIIGWQTEDGDEIDDDDPLLYTDFDFSPLGPLADITEIICNPIEYFETDDDDSNEDENPWVFYPYAVVTKTGVEWIIRARRRNKR